MHWRLVAAGNDVEERPFELHSGFSGHGDDTIEKKANKSILMPDPIAPSQVANPFAHTATAVALDSDRVQMHIAAEFQKIAVPVDQNGFVPALVEMADPAMGRLKAAV
jgi:hypothetical protein